MRRVYSTNHQPTRPRHRKVRLIAGMEAKRHAEYASIRESFTPLSRPAPAAIAVFFLVRAEAQALAPLSAEMDRLQALIAEAEGAR